VKRQDPRVEPMREDLNIGKIKPKTYTVKVPMSGLYRRPSKTSGMDTQLVYGTSFGVYDIKGRWAWGQELPLVGKPGYVGYVPTSVLSIGVPSPNKRIQSLRAPVFAKPDLKSQIKTLLPLNALIATGDKAGDYLHIKGLGYVHKNHCIAAKSRAGDFVSVAKQHSGLPYIWGGIGPDGLDCSGLVLSSLRAVGRAGLRDTDMQEKSMGKPVEINKRLSGLTRGDLIFWKGHVGIMTSAKTLLHANAYHMSVIAEPLNEATRRIARTAGPITSIKRFGWA